MFEWAVRMTKIKGQRELQETPAIFTYTSDLQ